ncbi:MAG TPA: sugar phosphate isomerase/epimerase, partial [Firmicutes bacterium]|nr:sugar phosphate isomerase/epimerase [Bacillota bacterium]
MSKLPVGIQVYSLRDLLEGTPENFKPVMEKLKAMGYAGVELAGLYGLEPAYVRDVLGQVGLVPVSAHVPFADLLGDLDRVISDYKTVGVEYIAVPYLDQELRPLGPRYGEALAEIKRIGQALRQNG